MRQQTVLITGASRGIGQAFARLFAAKGFALVLVAKEEEELKHLEQQLKQKHRIPILAFSCDFSTHFAAQDVFNKVQQENVSIDILINNAGFGLKGKFTELPFEVMQSMITVNINALVELAYLFLPMMKTKSYGKILNVSSTASFQPGPGMAIYFATKAFITSFSQALSAELEGTGITVSTLCPGPTRTHFAKTALLEESKIHKGIAPLWEADDVAKWGYEILMKGKRLSIVGYINKFYRFLSAHVPTKMVLNYIKKQHQ